MQPELVQTWIVRELIGTDFQAVRTCSCIYVVVGDLICQSHCDKSERKQQENKKKDWAQATENNSQLKPGEKKLIIGVFRTHSFQDVYLMIKVF